MSNVMIQQRKLLLVNTDPQRRCYNGCNFSEELQWTAWSALEEVIPESTETRLEFWRSLAKYAESQGREKTEYRVWTHQ